MKRALQSNGDSGAGNGPEDDAGEWFVGAANGAVFDALLELTRENV